MENKNILAIGLILVLGGGLLAYFFGFTTFADSSGYYGSTITLINILGWVGIALIAIGSILTFWALLDMIR